MRYSKNPAPPPQIYPGPPPSFSKRALVAVFGLKRYRIDLSSLTIICGKVTGSPGVLVHTNCRGTRWRPGLVNRSGGSADLNDSNASDARLTSASTAWSRGVE